MKTSTLKFLLQVKTNDTPVKLEYGRCFVSGEHLSVVVVSQIHLYKRKPWKIFSHSESSSFIKFPFFTCYPNFSSLFWTNGRNQIWERQRAIEADKHDFVVEINFVCYKASRQFNVLWFESSNQIVKTVLCMIISENHKKQQFPGNDRQLEHE